ncbi:MAG: hypothetical protein DSZ32_00840 [Gammaproteobacteria bacterium]|nr:MAG: hypothetical protein DSZ32_00840 [Gammaproteobacteria bacterium]
MRSDNGKPAGHRKAGWVWLALILTPVAVLGAAWVFIFVPLQQENVKLRQDLADVRGSISYYQQKLASADKAAQEAGRKLNETRQANELWQKLGGQGHEISRRSCDRRIAFLEKQLRLAHKEPDSSDPGHLQEELKHSQGELLNLMELVTRVSGAAHKDCAKISGCSAELGQSMRENAERLQKARKTLITVMRLEDRLLLSETP